MNKFKRFLGITMATALALTMLTSCSQPAAEPATTDEEPASAATTSDAAATDGEATGWMPEKEITLIVPYAAGGSSDVMARVMESVAQEYLGVPLVVENIGGAGGTIGMIDFLNNYEHDGYTLIFPSSAPLASQPLMQELAYDPVTDYQLVAGVSQNSQVLVVPGDSPINSLDDLIATYEGTTGEFVYGYPAVASNPYLAQELLFQEIGLVGTGVPLGGSADVVTAVLGGHVDIAACTEQEALELHLNGDLKILGSFSEMPLETAGLEDIETFVEMGYEVTFANWRSVLAHNDIPEDVLAGLQEMFVAIVNDPAMTEFIAASGEITLVDMDHDGYVERVSTELETNTELFTTLGVGLFE